MHALCWLHFVFIFVTAFISLFTVPEKYNSNVILRRNNTDCLCQAVTAAVSQSGGPLLISQAGNMQI
jgi:hypothetical protein